MQLIRRPAVTLYRECLSWLVRDKTLGGFSAQCLPAPQMLLLWQRKEAWDTPELFSFCPLNFFPFCFSFNGPWEMLKHKFR